MNKHINITVKGRVQGVGFRYHSISTALNSGISGFVTNRSDGSVYIEAEGNDDALKAFTSWCRQGPSGAVIEKVIIEEGNMKNFNGFNVR